MGCYRSNLIEILVLDVNGSSKQYIYSEGHAPTFHLAGWALLSTLCFQNACSFVPQNE